MESATQKIAERITKYLQEKEMNANEFTELCGFRKGIMTDWKTGRSSMSLDNLIVICTILNCSSDELLQLDTNRALNKEESLLLSYFNKLSSNERWRLIGNIEAIVDSSFQKESSNTPAKYTLSQPNTNEHIATMKDIV